MVKPGGTGTPARLISAKPAPLPPRTSFILPSPSAFPPPNAYTCFFINIDLPFCHDLGEVSHVREFRKKTLKQRKPVAPDVRIGSVDEHLIEKQVDFGPQRADAGFEWLAIGAPDFLVKVQFRPRFEEIGLESGITELRLLQHILDSLKAGGDRVEVRGPPDCLDAFQARFKVDEVGPARGNAGPDFVIGEAADIAEVVFDAVTHKFPKLVVAGLEREG